MTSPLIPRTLRSNRALAALNVLAVGAAMGAATAVSFGALFGDFHRTALAALTSTAILGTLWAALLRAKTTVGARKIRIGWLLSPPLAALNAVLAEVCFGLFDGRRFTLEKIGQAVLSGLFSDAVYWIPSCVIVLLCFGLPIAWSQRLATRGLAGRERGEGIIGAVSCAIAGAALSQLPSASSSSSIVLSATTLVAALAMVLGAWTLLSSTVTALLRRRFVAQVEAGKVERFRVELKPEGKVLVRVTPQGEGYRVADFEEEVASLNEDGEVIRSHAR